MATSLETHDLVVVSFGGDQKRTVKCINRLITLHEAWHAAEPGNGYEAQAAEWRAKLAHEESGNDN